MIDAALMVTAIGYSNGCLGIGAFNSAFIQTNETKFKAEFELSWIWFDAEIKLTGNLLL